MDDVDAANEDNETPSPREIDASVISLVSQHFTMLYIDQARDMTTSTASAVLVRECAV